MHTARRRTARLIAPMIAVAAVLAAQPPVTVLAQIAPGFTGTWTLNQDTSTFEPPATRPDRRIVTLALKGIELTHTTETERTRILDVEPFQERSTTKVTYAAKLDGREYPVPNSSAKVKLTRVNATTFERTAISGTASEMSTWSLAADMKTLTVKTTGTDAQGGAYTSVQTYERQ